ncbi:23S rRNA (uracil(1939)-C(5))-methyltransferase RlmD [Marinobacterium jannaschii]|uniref:23S rRNA (uracil(1939)-C(5))-methyltransferase RlmD n=1 Tax=Marinobacterium jannaschii TaxID=64970 RepID=UPI000484A8CE|nr:23S rRNA (uracil(1939)-C(5))-methyltransferase RlmD [Marinobacterium jannaschii]
MKRSRVQFGRPKKASPKNITSEPFQLDIDGLSHEGRGIGRHNGKTCFVTNALPGETVMARITQTHRRYDEAECIEVITASADRIDPVCAYYGTCGGCNLQHLKHDAQIEAKQALVLDQLNRLGKVSPLEIEPAIESTTLHYRRSARVGINQLQRDGSPIVGFRRRNSSKLVQIDQCPVLLPAAERLLQALPQLLAQSDNFKGITHAEITLGDREYALTLRIKQSPSPALIESIRVKAEALGFRLYIDNGNSTTAVAAEAELSYQLTDPAQTLSFRPGDFLQVNAEVNKAMISRAIQWLAPTAEDRILDLFCGIGNFTLPLAARAGAVVGVEGSAEMVQRATDNAENNSLGNCSFYRADLSTDLSRHDWYQQGFTKILLDPPRTGALEAIRQLAHYNARELLYVSCNPAALARDAAELAALGYVMEKFCVMDMFPQTAHVESLALFRKAR